MDSVWPSRPKWRVALDRLSISWDLYWLIAVAAAIRFFQLGSESLWFDEAFTARVVAQGTDFWRAVLGDDHPPLWSMLQWVNVRIFGGSEWAFRLPALVFSVGCVILIWRIALALRLDRTTALIAGLIAAFLPASIYFGQDGRMYAALAFFLLLALWGVLENRYSIVFIGGLLAVYTQNAGVLYIAALGIGVISDSLGNVFELGVQVVVSNGLLARDFYEDEKIRAFRWSAVFMGIGFCWMPWLPQMMLQAARVQQSFWQPGMNGINWIWPLMLDTMGWRTPDLLQIPLYGLAIALTLISLWVCRSWLISSQGAILLVTMIGGPALLAFYSLISARSIYVYRPLFVTGLLVSILWAYALTHVRIENRIMLAILLISALIIGDISHYTNDKKEDIPSFLAPISIGWQRGDCVFYANAGSAVLFGHYLPDKRYFVQPSQGSVMSITSEDQAAFNLPILPFEQLGLRGCERAWFISILTPFAETDEIDATEGLLMWKHTVIADKWQSISRDSIYLINIKEI